MARPNARDDERRSKITDRIGAIGFALPGTLIVRRTSCKKQGCRCMADPPQLHGPYFQWTRKVNGTTVTRLLTQEQMDRYGPWFDNAKQARVLLSELEALSLRIAESIEDWGD
jgi:hypothetical protein